MKDENDADPGLFPSIQEMEEASSARQDLRSFPLVHMLQQKIDDLKGQLEAKERIIKDLEDKLLKVDWPVVRRPRSRGDEKPLLFLVVEKTLE